MKPAASLLMVLGLLHATNVLAYEPTPRYCYRTYYAPSTPEAALAHGLADIIRSAGDANRSHSEAAKNWEQARRMNLENRAYRAEAYFDMQRLNRQARHELSRPRPTQEDLARYARLRAPRPLTEREVDAGTGQIHWPSALQQATYTAARNVLESSFRTHAQQGYVNDVDAQRARTAVNELRQQLQSNIHGHVPQDYARARQFVDRLGHALQAASA